jgi:hypothetical protein
MNIAVRQLKGDCSMVNKSFSLKVGESNSTPLFDGNLFIKLEAIQNATRVTVHVEFVSKEGTKHGNYSINPDTDEGGEYKLHHLGFEWTLPILTLNEVSSELASFMLVIGK